MYTHYTGIGTRKLLSKYHSTVSAMASIMQQNKYVLRSGAADGNDTIHELIYLDSPKEIYLPWDGFNGRQHCPANGYLSIGARYKNLEKAITIAKEHITHWDVLSSGAKKLHTRNALQVLGAQLDKPSLITIIHTNDGIVSGGTSTAVKISNTYGVPIRDLYHYPPQEPREIFVFGSNLSGSHGGGAARYALLNHGAISGTGEGIQGDSYGIPTIGHELKRVLSLEDINYYVARFIWFARFFPEYTFKVSRIGCGIAGLQNEQVAPLFQTAPYNCMFDEQWKPFLGDNYTYFTY